MKHALIIGASGGIGAALAQQLAPTHRVTGLSRKAGDFDLKDPPSIDAAVARVASPIDLAVIATGILAPRGSSPEKSLDALDAGTMAQVFAINAVGPALMLRAIAPKLSDTARVGVLTARVGSIGDNRMGGWYSYRASKAAANQITRGAAIEIGRKRKQAVIVALHPGTVETSFTEGYKAPKVSAEDAATNLLDVLTRLTPAQSGGFYDYAGQEIPW